MAGKKRFAINVLMNWAAMAVNMVVPFFLTPFVVRHLGSVGYGVWILAVSSVSYLNLLDLGLRSAVIRYVSKAQARGEMREATSAIHAALWFRILIAAGVSLLSLALAAAVPHFFKIPPELMRPAQITVLLCALGVAVTLVSGVFGAVLAAINRFDLLSYITMGQTLTRACGVLLILRSGHGLVRLASWELIVLTAAAVATTLSTLIIFPHSRVRPGRPDMGVLRMIWSYSMATFVLMLAVQLVYNTDNLVVGAFLPVSIVAFYAVGGSLAGYASQVSGALSTTFTPLASGLEASGRTDKLQEMVIRGTQATLGLALPIAVALLFRGRTFIDLWMGPQFGLISETVLQILLINLFLSIANGTASSIVMGIEKHGPLARYAIYEALLNLALSIALVKTIGLYGVAWGTAIAAVFIHVGFWPPYVRKVLGVPIRTYIWDGWGKVTLCSIPFAMVSAAADHYWHPTNLATFFGQILVTLPVYAVCVLAVFRRDIQAVLRNRRQTVAAVQV